MDLGGLVELGASSDGGSAWGRRAAAMAQPCLLTLELEEEEGERGAGNSRRIRHTGCAWGG